MARLTTEDEIKKALLNSRVFIVKRRSKDGAMSRWPFIAARRQDVIDHLNEIDIPGCEHEIEDVFPAPTLVSKTF